MNFEDKKEEYFMIIASKLANTTDNCACFDMSEFNLDRREDTRAQFVDWLNSFNDINVTMRARAIIDISVSQNFIEIYGE